MTISHQDEIHKRDKEYCAENYMEKCIKWANDTLAKDYMKRCRMNSDESLYDFFAHNCSRMRIPDHYGILYGYFDNNSSQWIYEPDVDFIKDKYPSLNDEQRYVVCCIKVILELRLAEYTDKEVTVDVNARTNNKDPDHPYLYTVRLESKNASPSEK